MDDPKYKTWAGLAESFTIFAKYGEGKWKTLAEHDIIYAGPNPEEVSKEDIKRLEQLGWDVSPDDLECFGYLT